MCVQTYYLWPFQIGDRIIVTRGQDQDEAYRGIETNLERGVTVAFLDNLPIDAAALYDQNHNPGWLHREPMWLLSERVKNACSLNTWNDGKSDIRSRMERGELVQVLQSSPLLPPRNIQPRDH